MHFSLLGILIIVIVVFFLVFGSIRIVIRRDKERAKTFDFSGPGVIEKPKEVEDKEDEDDDNSMSWEEIQEDMGIGKHYAKYNDYALSETELDTLLDHGWKLCGVDDDAYYFEKVAGGPA